MDRAMSSDGGIRSENRRRNEGRSSDPSPQHTSDDENGGAKVGHGSGGMSLLRAA
jgi:hypothetical protein